MNSVLMAMMIQFENDENDKNVGQIGVA